MMITITPDELIEQGRWTEACDVLGYNPYALAEGMPSDTEITLTAEQAIAIGVRIIAPSVRRVRDWE